MMTDDELATIEGRAKAATPFLAAARADVEALVAEVRRLRLEMAKGTRYIGRGKPLPHEGMEDDAG